MAQATIHVAYAIGYKNGTHYRARAYCVTELGIRCTATVAIDDTAKAATCRAVGYVQDAYRRDGLDAPQVIIDHGRKPGAILDIDFA